MTTLTYNARWREFLDTIFNCNNLNIVAKELKEPSGIVKSHFAYKLTHDKTGSIYFFDNHLFIF